MPVEVSSAAAVIEIVKLAHEQGWFDRLVNAFRTKHRVLILGPTGTGKTNLLDSLTEQIPAAIDLLTRTEFVEERTLTIEKLPFIFIDTPGQLGHKTKRSKAIQGALKTGVDGIINVVSYGYHESRVYDKSEAIKDGKASAEFLQKQRELEIQQLGEWTELLGDRDTAKWLITVVTKADLWWSQRKEVFAHYESGPYFQALNSAKVLHPSVLEYCSVVQKFWGEGLLSGEFEDRDRVRSRTKLLRDLLSAIGKGPDVKKRR